MATPRLKRIRRLGTPLPGLTRKAPREERRVGSRGGRRHTRRSDYRLRLEEKQKVRWHYGVSESQLQSALAEANRMAGPTGPNLLSLLERRLDSVVFRLGFAPTIRAARQLVAHGHVRVDGRRVDRSGYRVGIGETITLSARARAIPDVLVSLQKGPEIRMPAFLALDAGDGPSGRVVAEASAEDVPFLVDARAIVEFYAR